MFPAGGFLITGPSEGVPLGVALFLIAHMVAKSLQMVTEAMKLKDTCSLEEKL